MEFSNGTLVVDTVTTAADGTPSPGHRSRGHRPASRPRLRDGQVRGVQRRGTLCPARASASWFSSIVVEDPARHAATHAPAHTRHAQRALPRRDRALPRRDRWPCGGRPPGPGRASPIAELLRARAVREPRTRRPRRAAAATGSRSSRRTGPSGPSPITPRSPSVRRGRPDLPHAARQPGRVHPARLGRHGGVRLQPGPARQAARGPADCPRSATS